MQSYCISLESKKSIWPDLIKTIKNNGIDNVTMYPAVIGKNLTDPNSDEFKIFGDPKNYVTVFAYFNLVKNKLRRYHAQLSSWGAVGCYLSHISLWKNLLDSDPSIEKFLIFEDDISFQPNFKDVFQNSILPNIPENSDIIFLDVCRNFERIEYNKIFDKIGNLFFGLHAYIITRKGASTLLQKSFPIEIQLDSYISKYAELNNLNLYTSVVQICKQTLHTSSIQDVIILINTITNLHIIIPVIIIIMVLIFSFILIYRK